jgi:hypothetical protein
MLDAAAHRATNVEPDVLVQLREARGVFVVAERRSALRGWTRSREPIRVRGEFLRPS